MRHLDVAGGTGDVSFRIYEHLRRASASTAAPAPATIVVSDINPAMLQVGRKRAEERGYRSVVEGFEGGEGEEDAGPRLAWVEGNAEVRETSHFVGLFLMIESIDRCVFHDLEEGV